MGWVDGHTLNSVTPLIFMIAATDSTVDSQ